ncbi:GGDEF domain-containing protein [Paenibacillus campi]|uniref:GGDEF domain-containing protein n=1 Tax=Paenibacillus campi TaxID=3106031 RepID=UPI002AFFCBAA|nr:GGDEF domain-containing protein [Paenibacillus sp. SGZ-1014]
MNSSDSGFDLFEYIGKQQKWIRHFLKSYWVIVLLHFFAQLGAFLFLPYPATACHFYVHILFIPTACMMLMIVWADWMQRIKPKLSFFALFVTSTFITWTIIYLNYDIRIITALCLVPVFSAVIFFNKKLLWIPAALQMLAFVTLYLADPHFRTFLTPFDVISVPAFIIGATFVAHVIVSSGSEILSSLHHTMQSKQDLIVKNAIMSKISKTDGLTNLYNQVSFKDYYDTAFDYASRGVTLHLALLDIDNFKLINDTYGHQIGDKVLETVAQIIQQHISSSDIAARYGGEEFALLIFDKSFEDAYTLVENIRRHLALLRWQELDNQTVTISIGLHSCEPGLSKEQLFEQVDQYLYHAKRSGKNQTITASSIGTLA